MNVTKESSPADLKLFFLDALRGLAAIYVMLHHAKLLLWEGYDGYDKAAAQHGIAGRMLVRFFSLFNYGHEAVVFFFVLSGFVIHLQYAHRLEADPATPFRFRHYFKRRIYRIYPPFIFALLLTAFLDWLGRYHGYAFYSSTTLYNDINAIQPQWSVQAFMGNLLFLYKTYVPIYGTNGPIWSLSYEWWFYLLYPLFLLMGRKRILYPTIAIVILCMLSFFPSYWPEQLLQEVFARMLIWWMGVLLAEVYAGRLRIRLSYLAYAMLAIIPAGKFLPINVILYDLFYGLFFAGLLAELLNLPYRSILLRILEKGKWMGSFSYTLYIIHFPILAFISGWYMQHHSGKLPSHFGLMMVAGIFVTGIAWALHFLIERPFLSSKTKR